MEPSIIKEGFEKLADKGFYITEYIADADSNTFQALQTLPWKVDKVDCMNHALRNFTTKIESWKTDFNIAKLANP
jgi:hypothetical protein